MGEITQGDRWERDVEYIIRKVMNGGSKCEKGKLLEAKMTGLQADLIIEKEDRKKTDAEVFNKLDKHKIELSNDIKSINKTLLTSAVTIILFLAGVIVTILTTN